MEKEAEQKTEDNNNNNEDVDADPNSPNSSSVQKTKRYVLFISFLVKKKTLHLISLPWLCVNFDEYDPLSRAYVNVI